MTNIVKHLGKPKNCNADFNEDYLKEKITNLKTGEEIIINIHKTGFKLRISDNGFYYSMEVILCGYLLLHDDINVNDNIDLDAFLLTLYQAIMENDARGIIEWRRNMDYVRLMDGYKELRARLYENGREE